MTRTKLAFYQDRWWCILGVSLVMYVLSFVDRTNIAMAIPAMRSELRLSAVAIEPAMAGAACTDSRNDARARESSHGRRRRLRADRGPRGLVVSIA
jgi:hypothetical protein